ncbi:MAG TPA: VWA domain-containing protein, partial [Chitinophagaceae bacterium]|nr:VWA domain-containing protein [Chitinophagaceae bacterium]
MISRISRQTSLSKNIVQFCRFLRQKGFALSVEEEADALNALQYIDSSSRDIFRLALKATCCRSKSQLHEFDRLFNEYWKEIDKAVDSKIKTESKQVMKSQAVSFKSLKSWLNGNLNEEKEEMASYSMQENLSQKDFASVPDDEVDELMRYIKALSKRLAAHINRRYEKDKRISLPDLRRTLRKNMRRGGELIEIAFHKPKRNRTKLIVLCDVSKSMDLYAAFLLQFMYAFQQVYSGVETFAFSTSLQCITNLLKQNDFTEAMRVLNSQSSSWSGGTRIGESLNSFVKEYSKHVLNKHSIV